MGPALVFLTSLRTVAKRNQLVRFRMASTAATTNTVRFSARSSPWPRLNFYKIVWTEGPVVDQDPGTYQREVGGRGGRRKDHRDKCCAAPLLVVYNAQLTASVCRL